MLILLYIITITIVGALIDFYLVAFSDYDAGENENFKILFTNDLLSNIPALSLIFLSFFIPISLVLKQKPILSFGISIFITFINYLSWSLLDNSSATCCPALAIFMYLLAIAIGLSFIQWYKERYLEYLGYKIINPNIPSVRKNQQNPQNSLFTFSAIGGIFVFISGMMGILNGIFVIQFVDDVMFFEINAQYCGIIEIIFGVFAIIGGLMAVQRKKWGIAMTGSVFAIFPVGFIFIFISSILGIIGLILIASSKDEFISSKPKEM